VSQTDGRSTPVSSAFIAICILGLIGSTFLALEAGTRQTFAAAAAVKAVVLPASFAVLAWSAIKRRPLGDQGFPGPLAWAPSLCAIALISTTFEIMHSDKVSVLAIGQDLMMFGTLGVGVFAARAVGRHESWRIVRITWWFAAAISWLPAAMAAFDAIILAGLVTSTIFWRRLQGWSKLVPLLIAGGVVFRITNLGSSWLTGARALQLAAIAGVLLSAWWMRRRTASFALLVLAIASATACMLMWTTHGRELIGLPTQPDDVTIAQREYETTKVVDTLDDSIVRTLFGGGPGATVDLSLSPDVVTLLSSGRDVTAVDDVNLLSTHILMKLGLVGLAWLGLILICTLRLIHDSARAEVGPAPLIGCVFLAAWIANGIPAATNFLAAPLFGLMFGIVASAVQDRGNHSDKDTIVLSAVTGQDTTEPAQYP
jgi:hypothetical protein